MGYMILGIISAIILTIAGFFFWIDFNGNRWSKDAGTGGCIALALLGVVLAMWGVVGLVSIVASFFN